MKSAARRVAALAVCFAAVSAHTQPALPEGYFKKPTSPTPPAFGSEGQIAAADATAKRMMRKAAKEGESRSSLGQIPGDNSSVEIGKVVLPQFGSVFAPVTVVVEANGNTTKKK